MKVAVTGASGFIGRHVVDALSRMGDVEIVAAGRGESDPAATDARGIRRVRLDVCEPDPSHFERLGCPDVLIHLAWSGLPNYGSLHHFESELGHQYRFLSGLVHGGLPALVCAGTCFEYGMKSGPLDESTPTDPENPYGFAKDALRRQLFFLRDLTPYALTWARLFYIFGEGQATRSLYSQLIAAGGSAATSFKMSGGEQLRDYLPATEVAERLVGLALVAPDSGIVNVCSGRPVSVRALAEGWIRERGWNMALDLWHYPYPDYEPMAFWGSNRRLNNALGLS